MTDKFFNQLIERIKQARPATRRGDEPVIEVDGALRHLTALYERMRSVIDYQEERFIRRLAIRRILFRQLIIEGATEKVGDRLVRELIRAAYLENGYYPARIAGVIDELLTKYRTALPIIESRYAPPELIRMQRRLLGLAAAEIEDLLHPATTDRLLTSRLIQEIASYENQFEPDELCAIALRSLWKADAELLAHELLRTSARDLADAFAAKPANKVSDLLRLVVKCEYLLRDRRIETAVRRFSRLVPPYLILSDLTQQNPDELTKLASDQDRLERTLETLIHERLSQTESKLHRSILRTTIYILATKILTGLLIEIPYDLAVAGRIIPLPLSINLLISPLLMFAAGLGIRPPGAKNTTLLIERTQRLLNSEDLPALSVVEISDRRRPAIANLLFFFFYLATYLLSFGGLIWLLALLHFNFASILVFLFFLCVVGFFAYRIRSSAKELAIIRERESFLFLIFDFFALPFLRVGRFLTSAVRQLNIVLFVLDFLIEAPLKIILVALEDWFAFLREKREELS